MHGRAWCGTIHRMRDRRSGPRLRLALAARLVAGGVAAAAFALACSSTSAPSSGAPSGGGLDDGGGNLNPTVSGQDAAATGDASTEVCEELGTLSATSVVASYDADSRWFRGSLTGRLVATDLAVVAMGSAASLQGALATLGVDANANFATCTHCLRVLLGCTTTGCDGATSYLAKSGTALFNQVSSGPSQSFAGQFVDVTLRPVTIDPQTFVSTDLAGPCFHLTSFNFDAKTAAVAIDGGGMGRDGGDAGGDNATGSGGRSGGGYTAGNVK
jgi:hypothetical protein